MCWRWQRHICLYLSQVSDKTTDGTLGTSIADPRSIEELIQEKREELNEYKKMEVSRIAYDFLIFNMHL